MCIKFLSLINFISILLRSPNAYRDLRDSGFLILPSQRVLRYHKNKVKQGPGTNVKRKSAFQISLVNLFQILEIKF